MTWKLSALVMTADGTGIVSITRLDITGDAAADTDPGDAVADLGGFGDIISIDNGTGGVLLFGATWNATPANDLTMWTYDPTGATASTRFSNLTPPAGNLNLQLARTPDGRIWARYEAASGPVLRELSIDLFARHVAADPSLDRGGENRVKFGRGHPRSFLRAGGGLRAVPPRLSRGALRLAR